MDLWPCGRLPAASGNDPPTPSPDPTISSGQISHLTQTYAVADFDRIRTLSHAQTDEFMNWPFPAERRLPDIGVYLALKTLSVVERSERYPVDFDWRGNIRVGRKPCGEPVIVQAYGLFWIPVWKKSIILCGEELSERHGWVIRPPPSSELSELEPAFYAGLVLLPSDYQKRKYVEFLRWDYGRAINAKWDQRVTELNAHTDFTRGWEQRVLELTNARSPRFKVMRTIPGFRMTAVNPIVDIDCSHAPISCIPNHATLRNLPWQADPWAPHPRTDNWSFDPLLQRPFNPLPVQLIATRYDWTNLRNSPVYDNWLVLFAEIMWRVKSEPEQSAFRAFSKALVHRCEIFSSFPDSAKGFNMLSFKQISLDGPGGLRTLQFMESWNDAQQKVRRLGDTRLTNIFTHFLCAMQVPCLAVRPLRPAAVHELSNYLRASLSFSYESFLEFLRSAPRRERS
ncbi:uncharacterized protein N7477_003660 [Penicillium maclennaniae]|uniref:uncharacterized protein n=1 Tax=Penicillium maclennaniae TaxID=1343394 RepID=UPI0025403AB5|nr:uncharacterized protein N7477_003660 [Penicillium maclennaniae]KAJ5678027.1 hypothetical protein N7477_003660 [Penicillium maclennaniae]